MKSRHIALGLALASVAALAPVISNASPEKAALNACARAFASSLASPGAAAPAFKLAYHSSEFGGSMLELYAVEREYTFDLNANDPKTWLPIARASCTTDAHGAVVALSPVPLLHAAGAAVAARL